MKLISLVLLLCFSVVAVKAQNKDEIEKSVCDLPVIIKSAPEFVNGKLNFEEYIYQKIIYPKKARRKKTNGIVTASFIIEKDGTTSTISILKSLPNGCDQAVIDVLKRMPKWKPAIENGKLIRFLYKVEVKFESEKMKDKTKK